MLVTHGLADEELLEYRDEIDFVRAEAGSAELNFGHLRGARVLFVGHGAVLSAVVRAGIGNGLRWLHVLAGGENPTTDYDKRDSRQRVVVEPLTPDRVRAELAQSDLVVHVSADFGDLAEMCRLCGDAGVPLTQVFLRGEDVWLTPVRLPEPHAPVDPAWAALTPVGEQAGSCGPIGLAPSLIGAQAALTCFRHLTGMRSDPDGAESVLLRLELATLAITEHRG